MTQFERKPEEPPQLLQLVPKARARGKLGAKVGRPSQSDYVKLVCKMLRASTYELEECTALSQMPGVEQRRKQYSAAIFPLGMALHTMFEEAVSEIEILSHIQNDLQGRRMSTFLKVWYRERSTVTQVAQALSLSRSHVAHAVQRRALDLVTRRFLDAAWQVPQSA